MSKPLNVGCIGIGGYAGNLISVVRKQVSPDRARLAVVCTSRPQAVAENENLVAIKPEVVGSAEEVINFDGLDAVIIPTSIESHLPYATAALERGLHVFCEKPVTGTVQDAYKMIEARDRAQRIVAIGYQDHYANITQWAKQKILAGEIGKVSQAKMWAVWARADSYYKRASWAGAVKRNGGWVLDSPANNALSHEINIPLFVTGPSAGESNRATHVTAELYRARDIENFDTCGIKCQTAAGPEILILMTHACLDTHGPIIDFVGETGTLRRHGRHRFELIRDGQVVETCELDELGPHGHMINNFIDRIHGKTDNIICEIENAIAPLEVVNAASQCAPVRSVDPAHFRRIARKPEDAPEDKVCAINDIEQLFPDCFDRFCLPCESGNAPWTGKPGAMDIRNYRQFTGLATG